MAPIATPSRKQWQRQVRLPANVPHHLEQLGLGIDIADVDELPILYRPAGNRCTRRHQGMRRPIRRDRGRFPLAAKCAQVNQGAVELAQRHAPAIAQFLRAADDHLEHGLRIAR
jgi:hypothetical protein